MQCVLNQVPSRLLIYVFDSLIYTYSTLGFLQKKSCRRLIRSQYSGGAAPRDAAPHPAAPGWNGDAIFQHCLAPTAYYAGHWLYLVPRNVHTLHLVLGGLAWLCARLCAFDASRYIARRRRHAAASLGRRPSCSTATSVGHWPRLSQRRVIDDRWQCATTYYKFLSTETIRKRMVPQLSVEQSLASKQFNNFLAQVWISLKISKQFSRASQEGRMLKCQNVEIFETSQCC